MFYRKYSNLPNQINNLNTITHINSMQARGNFISISGKDSLGKNYSYVFSVNVEDIGELLVLWQTSLETVIKDDLYIDEVLPSSIPKGQYPLIVKSINLSSGLNDLTLYEGEEDDVNHIFKLTNVPGHSNDINLKSNFISPDNDGKYYFIALVDGKNGEYVLDFNNNSFKELKPLSIPSYGDINSCLLDQNLDLYYLNNNKNEIYKMLHINPFESGYEMNLGIKDKFLNAANISDLRFFVATDGLIHTSFSWNNKGNDVWNVLDIYPPTIAKSHLPLMILGIFFGGLVTIAIIVGIIYFILTKRNHNSLASTNK